jgi:hypothetical protein
MEGKESMGLAENIALIHETLISQITICCGSLFSLISIDLWTRDSFNPVAQSPLRPSPLVALAHCLLQIPFHDAVLLPGHLQLPPNPSY